MHAERLVTGANMLDLVKFIANLEKARGPVALSSASRALMSTRISLSGWYSLTCFHELLSVVERTVIKGDETRALEMGAAGGTALKGAQKAYLVPGDARSSVIAMRLAWRAHFNFGRLVVEAPEGGDILFRVMEYPDIPMIHGLLTAGWGLAAARAAGAHSATVKVLQRPWLSEGSLTYTIEF